MELNDPAVAYSSTDDGTILSLIEMIRNGIQFPVFSNFALLSNFNLSDWSTFLHISDRTMQRYKKENRTFDPLQSEKILEIALLFHRGKEVLGSQERFNNWLEIDNLALGKIKPRTLLDSSFGIALLKDELTRIEQGVLA